MGIAGFFLWLQRWYGECIDDVPQEVVDAALRGEVLPPPQPPDSNSGRGNKNTRRYDNLYIDMNGLIHPCCHDTHPLPEPESEVEMLDRLFVQLDLLVKVVQPRRVLVLAVDGVAPRSKLNQQRCRRFRAADERLESDAIAAQCAHIITHDYHLPQPHMRERWDSNVITPSTAFMERVALAIEWFVLKKLNEDAAWRHLAVVVSDAHVPGEGEHKIMQYIRSLRAQPGYDHRTTHVIHGMDADLVCLGLSTHEEHVSILRNQLTETFQPDHGRFCYFNLHTFRACLARDFANIASLQLERVLDDFVFLCFLVGNDFLPHVPLISIKTKGIELLLDHYVRHFDEHTYLTAGGEVEFAHVHTFLCSFVAQRMEDLRKEYHGVLRARQRAKSMVAERVAKSERALQELRATLLPDGSNAQAIADGALALMTSCVKERVRLVADQQALGFSYLDADYRDAYYAQKFGWQPTSRRSFEAHVRRCCGEYLRGMQWVMRYYTRGCPSWEWYYPYHYAPLLQDLAAYTQRVHVQMHVSAPLHPVEQLLAVLPRLSMHALPHELHDPVADTKSVLASFYPDKVDVDLSEANFAYQGVARIPFIDADALRRACSSLVELEEDVGATLLFCHVKSKLCRMLDELLAQHAAANTRTRMPHKRSDGKSSSSTATATTSAAVAVSETIAKVVPIAGRVGVYDAAWPRHARLDCPDEELAGQSAYGGSISGNAVRQFRYELDTQTEYTQELLRTTRKRERDAVATTTTSVLSPSKRSNGVDGCDGTTTDTTTAAAATTTRSRSRSLRKSNSSSSRRRSVSTSARRADRNKHDNDDDDEQQQHTPSLKRRRTQTAAATAADSRGDANS